MADAIQNKSKISSAVATATVSGKTADKTTVVAEAEAPAPAPAPVIDLDSKELYLNRELTWLAFNQRVLQMAADEYTPLLERVKFLAIVSVSLGVLNLLPIPILDGGHLFYNLIEWLRGKPLSEAAQQIGTQVGIVLLLILMSIAFYNDLSRLFGA